MTIADRDNWERKYASKDVSHLPDPDAWLIDCIGELKPGRALDLACGLGQNAIALAELGWKVDAVDVSPRGLEIARRCAADRDSTVNWVCADLDEWDPTAQEYDLVIVFRFLDWNRIPPIIERGLKPGGGLCYETFAVSQMNRADNHLKNAAFTVQVGDWEKYFSQFQAVSNQTICLPDRDVVRLWAIRGSWNSDRLTGNSPTER
jgi:SAM-dependent methyltransferase